MRPVARFVIAGLMQIKIYCNYGMGKINNKSECSFIHLFRIPIESGLYFFMFIVYCGFTTVMT